MSRLFTDDMLERAQRQVPKELGYPVIVGIDKAGDTDSTVSYNVYEDGTIEITGVTP